MPTWPSSLPTKPLAGTLKPRPRGGNAATFEPEQGEPIRRRRFTGRMLDEEATIICTKAQLERLFEFYWTDCADGSLSFIMPSWSDGSPRTTWFRDVPDPTNIRGGTVYQVNMAITARI